MTSCIYNVQVELRARSVGLSLFSCFYFYCGALVFHRRLFCRSGICVLGGYSFHLCTNLRHARLPATVRTLGATVFNTQCTLCLTINVPLQLCEIGYHAFNNCTQLQQVSGADSASENIFPRTLIELSYAEFRLCHPLSTLRGPWAPPWPQTFLSFVAQ